MAGALPGTLAVLLRASQRATKACLRPGNVSVCANYGTNSYTGTNRQHCQFTANERYQPLSLLMRSLTTQTNGPPKRPPFSGYIMFSNEKRPTVTANNPRMTVPEMGKALGEMWRNASANDKQVYQERAKSARETFEKEQAKYMSGLSDEEKQALLQEKRNKRKKLQELKKKKMLKNMDKPKQTAGSGYMVFAAEKLKTGQRGDVPVTVYVKTLATEWKNKSDQDKKPYDDQGRRNREEYQAELNRWEARMMDAGHVDLIRGYKPPKPETGRSRRPKRKLAKPKTVSGKKKVAASKKKTSKSGTSKKRTTQKDKIDKNPSWMREE